MLGQCDSQQLHTIGGGTRNRPLNQLAADAAGRHVVAGSIEATAIGNILVQMMALGRVASLAEGRQIVCGSFDVETYEPQGGDEWKDAYGRFLVVTRLEVKVVILSLSKDDGFKDPSPSTGFVSSSNGSGCSISFVGDGPSAKLSGNGF